MENLKASASENPYLSARREWDERYGSLISREKQWRITALVCAVGAVFAICGLVVLSTRSRIGPFVIAMDSLGRPVAMGSAEQTSSADDRVKRAALYSWIEDIRLVTTDGTAQRKSIDRVYAFVASGSQAQAFVSEFYRGDPPQKRAHTDTVTTDVQSILPTSDRTFEIGWIETMRDSFGAITQRSHWKGALTIALTPPTDESAARVNPLGIYVAHASWNKLLYAAYSSQVTQPYSPVQIKSNRSKSRPRRRGASKPPMIWNSEQ